MTCCWFSKMPQVRILSPRCDQKPVPSWCLNRPARGGFFIALPAQASCLNGLLTTRWRQRSQGPTLVQVAEVDNGHIN